MGRPFDFSVDGTTVAAVRAQVGSEARRDVVAPYRVRGRGDLLRVVLVPGGRATSRPTWSGVMADEDGGVRFAGRLHDPLGTFVAVAVGVLVLFLGTLSVLALTGGDVGIGIVLGGLALGFGALVVWHARGVGHVLDEHGEDTVRVLRELLSVRRRPAPPR